MSELDQFKLNEIRSFRDKLISTGKISQSMVTGLEDVIGSNPITSIKRIQHFTGNESHYGCQDVINILNNLLDSEPGMESVTATAFRNPDAMLGIAINILEFILPTTFRNDKLVNPYNIFDKFFKTPLDTVYLANREDFRGLKLGNLTGPEFLSILTGLTIHEDGLSNTFKDEYSRDIKRIRDIIRDEVEGVNSLAEDGTTTNRPYIHTDEAEIARSIYKLAFENLITGANIVKIPGYTSNSVSYNLFTINELINHGKDILELLDNARSLCLAARVLYRNDELFNNMSLSYLIGAACTKQNNLSGDPTTLDSKLNIDSIHRMDKKRDFVKLNSKSLSSMYNRSKKLTSAPEGVFVPSITMLTKEFVEELFKLINSNEKFVQISMMSEGARTSYTYGYKLTTNLLSVCKSPADTNDLTILESYLRLLTML